MIPSTTIISSFSELQSPLLTAYLNTQPPEPSTHGLTARPSIWLEQEAKRLIANVSPEEQELFRQQLARIEEFLSERTPQEKALVVLAGLGVWEVLPLSMPIENELHWGRPALTQLQWILSENKPHCIVVVDRKGARFFRCGLGEMQKLSQQTFKIDISQWKRKELGHFAGQGVDTTGLTGAREGLGRRSRGSQHDTFDHRMDAQYQHLCRETAARARRLCEADKLPVIFLVGSKRLTEPIEAELSKDDRLRVVLINEDFGWLPLPELHERLKAKVAEWEHAEESALVTKLLEDERTAVIGIDETLAQLQKGKMRTVVLTDHLNGTLHECIECGFTDRSADPVCSVCGRERRATGLRDTVLDLARNTNTEIEVVSGSAATTLNQSGGMGGWLRGRTPAELR